MAEPVAPNPLDYTTQNFEKITGIPSGNPPAFDIPKFDPAAVAAESRQLISNLTTLTPSTSVNPFQMGKQQMYGVKEHQFERYYEHPKFDTLGFTPFRDNEAFYNKNSSGFDDFRRAVPQFLTLTSLGFSDALGFGDLTDIKAAKEYEKAMMIGSSTRGGFTGFANNLFLNSGYTIGIMGEMVLEEVGLALLTAGTAGAATPLTGPIMAARATRAFSKIKGAYDIGGNLLKTMTNLGDINKARQYFTSSLKGVGNFINPLEQTFDYTRKFKTLNDLDNLAKVSLGFGSFYRDVRNARLVYGESALEGGFVQNQMEEQLLSEHYDRYDRPPTKEEADAIRQTSYKAGKSTALWNMPVIHLSNKMVFDNMFKAFSPMKRLTGDVLENVGGGVLKTGKKVNPFEAFENTIKGRFKKAINVKQYPSRLLSYSKANIAEGLQESFQEVISGANREYYMDQYSGATRGGVYSYIGDNIKKQFTAEGAEIFFSGFLMGGMVQAPQRVVSKGMAIAQAKGLKNYRQQKVDAREANIKKANILNEMYSDPAKYFAPDLENLVEQEELQKGMVDAQKRGDTKAFMDLKDASVYNHIATAIELGTLDTFIERLEDYKGMTAEEFKEAFPGFDKTKNSIAALDKVIERTKFIEKGYKEMRNKFPNPHNPSAFKYGTAEYKAAMGDKIAWDNAIKQAVFAPYAFARTLERIQSTQGEIKEDSALGNVPASDFSALFSITDTDKELSILKVEVKTFEGVTVSDPTARKYQSEKKAKLKTLTAFKEAQDKYLSTPEDSKNKRVRRNKLYKAYSKHLRGLAKVSKDHVFDVDLKNSFDKLLDLYALEDQSQTLTDAVNTITNPKGFARFAARAKEQQDVVFANKKVLITEALEKYRKEKLEPNTLLGDLYEQNIFFDPEQMEALIKDGKIPDAFYYAEGNNKLDEILETSDDYQKAMDIVEKYVENVVEKPISEHRPSPYDMHQRNKLGNDKRTYADYAKEFGFDPKAKKTTLPLKQVLQTIIKSKFVSKREVALAKRLLLIAQDGETVTFDKTMNTPGEYNSITQTSVDLRYSSTDYNGIGIPLEVNILRQEIHRQGNIALEKDPKFKADIQKIFDTVKEYYAKQDTTKLPVQLGFASLEDFVAQTMIDPRFQMLLAQVPFAASTKKSTWTEFVDSVTRMLKRFFGKESTNTALNGAIDAITTKFDNSAEEPGGIRTKDVTEVEQVTVLDAPITVLTILSVINNTDPAANNLRAKLLAGYKERNRDLKERDENPLDPNWNKKSDDEILSSKQFLSYIQTNAFTPVRNALAEYNKVTGRDKNAVAKPVSKEVPTIITDALKQALIGLEYTAEDIAGLTPQEATRIVEGNIKKLVTVVPKVTGPTKSERDKKRQDVINLISNATPETFASVENRILDIIMSEQLNQLGFTSDELDAMLAAKIKDFPVDFTKLRIGQEIIIDRTKNNVSETVNVIIDEKTVTEVFYHKVGDVNDTGIINISEAKQSIKTMEQLSKPVETITDTEKNIVISDFKKGQSLTDEDSLKADNDKARTITASDAENDLLNGIKDC